MPLRARWITVSYVISQHKRKHIEQVFGSAKALGNMREGWRMALKNGTSARANDSCLQPHSHASPGNPSYGHVNARKRPKNDRNNNEKRRKTGIHEACFSRIRMSSASGFTPLP